MILSTFSQKMHRIMAFFLREIPEETFFVRRRKCYSLIRNLTQVEVIEVIHPKENNSEAMNMIYTFF